METKWHLAEELTREDVQKHPVWEFINDETHAPDSAVRPVGTLPVNDLDGRLVGTKIKLHNGSRHWAILGNFSLKKPRTTKHFLTVSIEKDGRWFALARYHDVDFEERSPAQLAKFLGHPFTEVFPMEYDLSYVVEGEPSVIIGNIPEIPDERLTGDQLIELPLQ